MQHAEATTSLPMQLPDALGPYSVSETTEEERRKAERRKKKKKHKSSSSPHHSGDDDGEVKKKKKKEREDGEVAKKKKKKKRRTPEEQLMREAARRKSRKQLADFDEAAGIGKSGRRRHHHHHHHHEDPGLSHDRVRVPVRMEDEGEVDTGMRKFETTRQSSRQLQPDEVDAAFGGMQSQDVDPTFTAQPEINWETGEGLEWPDEHDVSVITPLSAFDNEPSLREDVEDPFVPVTTSFSGLSPGVSPEHDQWQTEPTEQGPEVDDPPINRPGRHRVDRPTYQAPLSRYSGVSDRSRRSSAPPGNRVRSGTGSLLSEKRRVSLPLGLYPIAETGEPPEKKKEGGKLSLFPVDETYDSENTTKEKSVSRLSYSSTGESYAQFEASGAVPGGTYIATRRISDKRRRQKERGNGPSYFRSSERYTDDNLIDDRYGRSLDMESQALGEDRLGAFAISRMGDDAHEDSQRLLMEHPSDGIRDPSGTQQTMEAEVSVASGEKRFCQCNKWLKLLIAFFLLAGIAVAIAVPLTLVNNNDDTTPTFPDEEVSARKQKLLIILDGVTDPNALNDKSSPQYAAVEWMSSEDVLSPLNNGILSAGITKLILQRYALAVFYYSTTGDRWFSAEGWLNGHLEECSWQFIECVDEDVVSVDTGGRNNLVGSIEPEIKELTALRSLIVKANVISVLSSDIAMLSNLAELDLSQNAFEGTIPTAIFDIISLRRLMLSENTFTGTLPTQIINLAGLTHLSLDTNGMNGLVTREFHTFSELLHLDLSNNFFEGDFSEMFAGLDQLETILLVNNRITGSLSPDIQRFTNLAFLDLGTTTMQGSIPTEMGTLTNLRQLLLDSIGLTGTIPTELGNLSSLEIAYFQLNKVEGSVPTEMCVLPLLTDLRVDCNVQCTCEACGAEGCRRYLRNELWATAV